MRSDDILFKYEIISKIGQGGFGIIYKAKNKRTGKIVTIKQINKNDNKNEYEFLNMLKGSPYVVNIQEEIDDENGNIYLIYDYNEYDIGSLMDQEKQMNIKQIKSYIKQMLLAVKEVHNFGIIHCDIKPCNFLVSSNNFVKITDFGISEFKKTNNKRENFGGTLKYMAPEILLRDPEYDEKRDIWSLGCSFYQMMTGENLFNDCYTKMDVIAKMVYIFGVPDEKEWPGFANLPGKSMISKCYKFSQMTAEEFLDSKLKKKFRPFKKILLGMLQMNPRKRITIDEVLNCKFLADTTLPENLPMNVVCESSESNKMGGNYAMKKMRIEAICDELCPERITPILIS